MGNVSSDVGKNVVNTLNNTITNVSASAVAKSNLGTTTTNDAIVVLGGTTTLKNGTTVSCGGSNDGAVNGNVTINQASTSNLETSTTTNATAVADISSAITDTISQIASNSGSQEAGWLSTALNVNITDHEQVSNTVNNILTNINTDVTTECKGFELNSNTGAIIICRPVYGDVTIDQQANTTLVSSCVSKLVFNAIASNSTLQSNIQSAENKYSQKTSGLFEGLEDILYVFAAVIVILILMSVISYFFRPRPRVKMNPPPYGMQAPSQDYGPPPPVSGPSPQPQRA